jgi:hypothetical protein
MRQPARFSHCYFSQGPIHVNPIFFEKILLLRSVELIDWLKVNIEKDVLYCKINTFLNLLKHNASKRGNEHKMNKVLGRCLRVYSISTKWSWCFHWQIQHSADDIE